MVKLIIEMVANLKRQSFEKAGKSTRLNSEKQKGEVLNERTARGRDTKDQA